MATPGTIVLSELLGRPVVTEYGRRLGRVADLVVLLGAPRPPVHHLLVRQRRAGQLVPWRQVAAISALQVVVRGDAVPVDPARPPLERHELLLARDVMDTQVVDLRGRRLSRVSDVILRSAGPDLEVAAVDLSISGMMRRLGLGRLVRRAERLVVAWPDLHLTSSRGHLVQLASAGAGFRTLDPGGLADLLARLSTTQGSDVVRAVDPGHAAAAIHRSHPHTGRRLVRALSRHERRRLMAAAADGQARTIAELGRHASPLHRRRFLRTAGWRVHRPRGG